MAETLPARIDDAIERPWAQVLQFALELHSDPAPIIRDMLARPDDAFSTGLRLVARCIANGATVDAALHAEVGDRLVAYWIYAHHHARDRVGQLIIDGFAQPISPALHQALHHRWLLNSGGAEIITRENDRALTLSVLNQLLRRPVAPLSLFHPLKLAISTLGDEAWERIMHTNEAADLTDDEQSGLDDLLSHFSPGSVTRDRALQAANDDRLPLKVRLNCVRIAGRPLTLEANSLVIQILRTDDRRAWRATELIALAVDPEALFLQLLGDDSIAKAHRINLAACLPQVFPDAAARDGAIERCRLDPAIPAEITAVTMLHAARHGDRATFALLVEELPTLSLLIASQAVSLFGHHPGRALAERAAALVEARVTTPEEATSFTHAADVGMRYIYQMDYGFGGSLFDTQPHAATVRWAQLLDTWSERDDLSDTQRMRILTTTAALGSERAQQRLDAMVLAIGDPDDLRYDRDDDYGQTMRAAVGEVRRRRSRIPLALAERLSRAKRPNVRYEGIDAIAAHGDHASLDLLLVLHAEAPDWSHKDTIESAVETLSAKLGIFVQREGNRLTICATPSCDSTTRTVRR